MSFCEQFYDPNTNCTKTFFATQENLTIAYGFTFFPIFFLLGSAFLGEIIRDFQMRPKLKWAPLQFVKGSAFLALYSYSIDCLWYIYNSKFGHYELHYLTPDLILISVGFINVVFATDITIIVWYELIDKALHFDKGYQPNLNLRYTIIGISASLTCIHLIFLILGILIDPIYTIIARGITGLGGLTLIILGSIITIRSRHLWYNSHRSNDYLKPLHTKARLFIVSLGTGIVYPVVYFIIFFLNEKCLREIIAPWIFRGLMGSTMFLFFLFVQRYTFTSYGPCYGYYSQLPEKSVISS
jgi:hypothetical protein